MRKRRARAKDALFGFFLSSLSLSLSRFISREERSLFVLCVSRERERERESACVQPSRIIRRERERERGERAGCVLVSPLAFALCFSQVARRHRAVPESFVPAQARVRAGPQHDARSRRPRRRVRLRGVSGREKKPCLFFELGVGGQSSGVVCFETSLVVWRLAVSH